MTVILKVGGSLLASGQELVRFLSAYALKNERSLAIVPGGGPFAETVRELSDNQSISDEAAHWMAILAMHQYGLFLADSEPGIPLVESVEAIPNAGHLCIVLPYKILKDDDSLPHSWDVTSDTIAAFIAHKLGETTFIKLTDVDGLLDEHGALIEQVQAQELIVNDNGGCVDAELPRFLVHQHVSCVIVNGNVPKRVVAVLESRKTICTRIC